MKRRVLHDSHVINEVLLREFRGGARRTRPVTADGGVEYHKHGVLGHARCVRTSRVARDVRLTVKEECDSGGRPLHSVFVVTSEVAIDGRTRAGDDLCWTVLVRVMVSTHVDVERAMNLKTTTRKTATC